MSANVIDFVRAAASARARRPAAPKTTIAPAHDFLFYTGASGRRYVHTIHSLIGCPELPAANVMLVRADTHGRRQVVRVMRVEHDAPSLNLAEVRQQGATLGATEVHVHLIAEGAAERRCIELDIVAADAADAGQRLAYH